MHPFRHPKNLSTQSRFYRNSFSASRFPIEKYPFIYTHTTHLFKAYRLVSNLDPVPCLNFWFAYFVLDGNDAVGVTLIVFNDIGNSIYSQIEASDVYSTLGTYAMRR